MSDATRPTLRERIEAGKARQAKRDAQAAGPIDRLTSAAKEHPLLVVLGGVAIGVALSTLIPRSPTRRLSRNALGFLTTVAELGLAYGRQAFDAAEEVGGPTRERLGDFGSSLQDAAARLKDKVVAGRD